VSGLCLRSASDYSCRLAEELQVVIAVNPSSFRILAKASLPHSSQIDTTGSAAYSSAMSQQRIHYIDFTYKPYAANRL